MKPALVHCWVLGTLVTLGVLAQSEFCQMEDLDALTQRSIIGGVQCNQMTQVQYCGTGSVTCNATCTKDQVGQRCTAGGGSQVQSSSGSIFVCGATSQKQSYCAGSDGTQSCTVQQDCICTAGLISGQSCKAKAGNGTITLQNVTATTNCTVPQG